MNISTVQLVMQKKSNRNRCQQRHNNAHMPKCIPGIEKMRKKNEEAGNRPRATYMAGNRQGITEKIETAPTQNDAVNFSNEGTELLPEYERIGALSSNDDDSEGTELLQNETEFLVEDNSQIERLKIVDSIVLIHSNEII